MKINLGNSWEKTYVPCYKLSVVLIYVIKVNSEYIFPSGTLIYSNVLYNTNADSHVLYLNVLSLLNSII